MHTGGLAGGVSDSVGSPPQKPKKPHDYGRSAGIVAKDIKLSGTTSGVSIYKRQRRVDFAKLMKERLVRFVVGDSEGYWVMVDPDGIDSDHQLSHWIEQAKQFVTTLPIK